MNTNTEHKDCPDNSGVTFEVSIAIDVAELNRMQPAQIQAFMRGVALCLAAKGDQ